MSIVSFQQYEIDEIVDTLLECRHALDSESDEALFDAIAESLALLGYEEQNDDDNDEDDGEEL